MNHSTQSQRDCNNLIAIASFSKSPLRSTKHFFLFASSGSLHLPMRLALDMILAFTVRVVIDLQFPRLVPSCKNSRQGYISRRSKEIKRSKIERIWKMMTCGSKSYAKTIPLNSIPVVSFTSYVFPTSYSSPPPASVAVAFAGFMAAIGTSSSRSLSDCGSRKVAVEKYLQLNEPPLNGIKARIHLYFNGPTLAIIEWAQFYILV